MFCLMDVSASMDEAKKDLAKRFFTLLYLFLTRKYEHVELVFVRHTDDAEEVDERTFFHDTKSGGTIVLSALQLMLEIVEARFLSGGWNIYAAQASDGDVFGADGAKSARFLGERLLPLARYFAYLETPDHADGRASSLWVGLRTDQGPEGELRDASRDAARRDLPGLPRAVPRRVGSLGRMSVLSTGADWDFQLIDRYERAIGAHAASHGLDTYPEPDRGHHLGADAGRLRERRAPRRVSALDLRQGVHPQRASSTGRATRRWPTRSSSTRTPASPTSWKRTP